MENYIQPTQNIFESSFPWVKPFCSAHPQPFGCPSTCTTLSQTSHPSPSYFDSEQGYNEETEYSQFPFGSPLNQDNLDNLDDSTPENSACAHDGSFDSRLEDTFMDLLSGYEDETGFQCEEDEEKELNILSHVEKDDHISFGMKKCGRMSKPKRKRTLTEGWNIIRKLFLKYLATPAAAEIIKNEMNQHQILWENSLKNMYRALRRQGKLIGKKNLMGTQLYSEPIDQYETLIGELLKKLFADFLIEKAEFSIRRLNDISGRMKETMLEILESIGRSFYMTRLQ